MWGPGTQSAEPTPSGGQCLQSLALHGSPEPRGTERGDRQNGSLTTDRAMGGGGVETRGQWGSSYLSSGRDRLIRPSEAVLGDLSPLPLGGDKALVAYAQPSYGGGGQGYVLRAQLSVPSSLRTSRYRPEKESGRQPCATEQTSPHKPGVGREGLPGPAADTGQGPENLEVPLSARGAAVPTAVCA